MIVEYIITQGLLYAFIGTLYLLIFMISFNPRIWGYQDYPDAVKNKVPPQTKRERIIAGIVGVPWFIFILFFPVISTYNLKTQLGGKISIEIAFLNVFIMILLFFLSDLVLLDWFIISKITPGFVIIPGSEKEDYKDFSHHYRGHAIASIPLTLISLLIAVVVVLV